MTPERRESFLDAVIANEYEASSKKRTVTDAISRINTDSESREKKSMLRKLFMNGGLVKSQKNHDESEYNYSKFNKYKQAVKNVKKRTENKLVKGNNDKPKIH
ncbi:hypothetical protein TSAR_007246 [Trichomalopsis sarcophagae]|uniref:Uncharacterized protein n=1 Tax=Trichomalopsis sarcophagae TaxID=543379 RepID=A0A232EW78_9HYME|nr:hypothetical protein TSAR_007246 [Trichomalopsis sarcophagae]